MDYSFHATDILNIMFGTVEGAASAIPSSTYNYQCGKNVTNARLLGTAANLAFSQNNQASGMANIYKMLQLTDDIVINCVQGFEGASNLNS